MTISGTQYAAATPMPPCSTSLKMGAVRIRQRALVSKTIAETLVMCRAKLKVRAAPATARQAAGTTSTPR
jgi:hypothetical protein